MLDEPTNNLLATSGSNYWRIQFETYPLELVELEIVALIWMYSFSQDCHPASCSYCPKLKAPCG